MSDFESMPQKPEQNISIAQDDVGAPGPAFGTWDSAASNDNSATLFQSFSQPQFVPPARIPHLGHLALLAAFLFVGALCMTAAMMVALHFHLDGVSTQEQIENNVHYLLGSEAILYLVTLALSIPIFPLLWNKSFFSGIYWRGATALQLGWRLPAIALGCIALAVIDDNLLPGPEHAPIVEFFRSPGAAWLMFGFGVAVAPFFEEIVFRGFLLPALATACDWVAEQVSSKPHRSRAAAIVASAFTGIVLAVFYEEAYGRHRLQGYFLLHPFMVSFLLLLIISLIVVWVQRRIHAQNENHLDADGHPQWSIPAMVFASVFTTIPFALLHAEQQGHSLGPFLQVITVSLILCAVRLVTR